MKNANRRENRSNWYPAHVYDSNNRLLTSTKTADNGAEIVTTYTYDQAGNQLLQITEVTGPATGGEPEIGFTEGVSNFEQMQYDGFNRLVSSLTQGTDGAMVQVSYAYRPDGLRHSKDVGGMVTSHLWDGSNIIADQASDGSTTRYIRGAGLIARQENSGSATPGALEYYMKNAHGDVVQLTDQSGEILKSYSYDAFGVEQNIDPEDTNVFRYCGEYFDKESGTIYLRVRYYSPRLGRFSQEDSARDGINWYTYCNNNPVTRIDPSGLDSYVYYDPNDIKDEGNKSPFVTQKKAEQLAIDMNKYYGTDVHLIPISSTTTVGADGNEVRTSAADNFVSEWNQMGSLGNGKIEGVGLYFHGNPEGIGFKNPPGSADKWDKDFNDVGKLDVKSMDTILMLGCGSGDGNPGIAGNMAGRMDANQLIAAKGTSKTFSAFGKLNFLSERNKGAEIYRNGSSSSLNYFLGGYKSIMNSITKATGVQTP